MKQIYRFLSICSITMMLPTVSFSQQPPKPPVPQGMVDQAKAQANGTFPAMARTPNRAENGGQIQDVWTLARDTAGVITLDYCGTCTYKITTRQHMTTLVELPSNLDIEKIIVGDATVFEVIQEGKRSFKINTIGFGADTNLLVKIIGGQVLSFYVRAERVNSTNIPDLYVRIAAAHNSQVIEVGPSPTQSPLQDDSNAPFFKAPASNVGQNTSPLDSTDPRGSLNGLQDPSAPKANGDFVLSAPFNPDDLYGWGQYKIWGGGDLDQVDNMIPLTVYRDQYRTYLKYGAKWKALELPTAYFVKDGVDVVVNTRIKGSTYIIEKAKRLITLKSGKTFICILFTGEPV